MNDTKATHDLLVSPMSPSSCRNCGLSGSELSRVACKNPKDPQDSLDDVRVSDILERLASQISMNEREYRDSMQEITPSDYREYYDKQLLEAKTKLEALISARIQEELSKLKGSLVATCEWCNGKGYTETGGMAMEDDLVEKEPCDQCDERDAVIDKRIKQLKKQSSAGKENE